MKEDAHDPFRLGDLVSDKRNHKLGIIVDKKEDSAYPGGMLVYGVRQGERMCYRWRFEICTVTSVEQLEKKYK